MKPQKGMDFFKSVLADDFVLESVERFQNTLRVSFTANVLDPVSKSMETIQAAPKVSWLPDQKFFEAFNSFEDHLSRFLGWEVALTTSKENGDCKIIASDQVVNHLTQTLKKHFKKFVIVNKITFGGDEADRWIKIDGFLKVYGNKVPVTTKKILLEGGSYGYETELDGLIEDLEDNAYGFVCKGTRQMDLFSGEDGDKKEEAAA